MSLFTKCLIFIVHCKVFFWQLLNILYNTSVNYNLWKYIDAANTFLWVPARFTFANIKYKKTIMDQQCLWKSGDLRLTNVISSSEVIALLRFTPMQLPVRVTAAEINPCISTSPCQQRQINGFHGSLVRFDCLTKLYELHWFRSRIWFNKIQAKNARSLR